MQLQIDRPINSQKHLNFVKCSDSFVSSLGAAKTEMVRIAQQLHLYFMQSSRAADCRAFAVAKAAPFCRARPRRSCWSEIPIKRSARDAPPVKRYRRAVTLHDRRYRERASAPARHHLRMRVIQYPRDISD
jgi:hypothetical protein